MGARLPRQRRRKTGLVLLFRRCSLQPGIPITSGKDAILKAYREELADPSAAGDETIVKIEVAKSGDLAYLQGISTESHTDAKTKKLMIEKGKWVTPRTR